MDDKIRQIVSDVCGVPVDTITDDSSPDSIETWDSMSHLHLILALESEFNVEFSPDDSLEMLSVGVVPTIQKDNLAVHES